MIFIKLIKQPFDFDELLDKPINSVKTTYLSDIPKRQFNLQQHPYYEFFYLIEGDVVCQTENGIYSIEPGDIILHDIMAQHRPIALSSNTRYERIILCITKEKLEQLSSSEINFTSCFQSGSTFYRFPFNIQQTIRSFLGRLTTLQHSNQFGRDLLINSSLTELFVLLSEQVQQQNPIEFHDTDCPDRLLGVIDQYILENLENEIYIDDLAHFVCMSNSSFMRTFKELTGKSVYQYIITKRLEAAVDYIKNGNDFISAAHACGFSDYSCFYRSFVKKYKVSPKNYFSIGSSILRE